MNWSLGLILDTSPDGQLVIAMQIDVSVSYVSIQTTTEDVMDRWAETLQYNHKYVSRSPHLY